MSFLVEVVVDRAVDSGEFLQTSHPPETKHRPLPSSEWLMRVLDAVVDPAAELALVDGTDLFQSGAIGCSRSVTIVSVGPCRRSDFLRNFNAVFLSRRFVTKLSSTSPS